MKSVKLLICFVLIMMILTLVSSVYAITGSIGNARMIVRVEQGEEIEKYILVKNVNDVSVDVELFAVGDLAEDIEIEDTEFTLQGGDERKAYFTIKVRDAGTSETKINVKFSPTDGGNGVGLSSTVIVIAKEKEGVDFFEKLFGGGSEDNYEDEVPENQSVSVGVWNKQENIQKEEVETKKSILSKRLFVTAGSSMFILLLVFFVLLIIALGIRNKTKLKKSKKDK